MSIKNNNEFLNLIKTNENNIIFCFHGWSGYSQVAGKIVEEWESISKREIMLIDASQLNEADYFLHWLVDQETGDWSKEGIMTINKYSPQRRVHGYGEICWIKHQAVVGFECIFDSFDRERLEIRTRELFTTQL